MFESNHGAIKTTVDEGGFEWIPYGGCPKHNGEGYIRVYEHGRVFVNSDAGRAIERMGEPTPDGYYKAVLGVAPKAIAIKLLPPSEVASRLCVRRNHTYNVNSLGLVKKLQNAGITFPAVFYCTIYEPQKLLLCKLPDKPARTRTR